MQDIKKQLIIYEGYDSLLSVVGKFAQKIEYFQKKVSSKSSYRNGWRYQLLMQSILLRSMENITRDTIAENVGEHLCNFEESPESSAH
jgi:hypothetical protein